MGDGPSLNKICDRIDTLKKKLDIKQKIIDKIEQLKAQCNGAPTFTIDASLPSLNLNFAIFYFLRDIIAVLGDLNMNEIRSKIINWIISIIEPIQRRLGDLLKSRLKGCFTCKVEPNINDWLFLTNPSTNLEGNGFNIRVEDIDDRCLFKLDPNSEYGKMRYDDGLNSFLWEVIQAAPNTLPWTNPNNGRVIAHFTFIEDSPLAFTEGSVGQPQTTSPETNVINMKIDDYYQNKTLTDFTVEFIDSILPLFDLERLLPASLDSTFGVISKELKDLQGDACIGKQVEIDALLDQLIEFGIDDEEVVEDNSFYEFDEKAVVNIKQTISERKKGQMVFKDCCNKKYASIAPQTVVDLNNQLTDTNVSSGKKVEIIEKSINSVISQTGNNVSPQDRDKAGFEFIIRFLINVIRDIWNLLNTPKNKILLQLMLYLTDGKFPKNQIGKFYRLTSCVQKSLLRELMERLLFEFIIPWILRNLRPIIMCVLGKTLLEQNKNYELSLKSLLPMLPQDKLDKIKGLLGKASQISNKLNLGELKDKLGLQGEGLGKFC